MNDDRVIKYIDNFEVNCLEADEGEEIKHGIILDTETTGLDTQTDEIIEYGMLPFSYTDSGKIVKVHEGKNWFNEPSKEISEKIQEYVNISPEDVKGKSLPIPTIEKYLEKVSLVIAHNSSFDRPIVERYAKKFRDIDWACSYTGINWEAHSISSSKLDYIAYMNGFYFNHHRALNDCEAVLKLLMIEGNGSHMYFKELLEDVKVPSIHIEFKDSWAIKNKLKEEGFRYKSNNKSWTVKWRKSAAFPTAEIYLRTLVEKYNIQERNIEVIEETAKEAFRDAS